MFRAIVLVIGLLGLAACEQPLAPAPQTQRAAAPVMSRRSETVIKKDTMLAIGGTIMDPCTNESIALSGSIHLVSTTVQTADGATVHSRLHTERVTGVGLVTGTTYRFIESLRETESVVFVSDSVAGKVTIRERIISRDELENYFADIVFTFTSPSFTPTYEIRNVRCEE